MRISPLFAALFIVLLSFNFVGVSESRAEERWRKIRLDVPDNTFMHRLVQMGVDFEGGRGKVGGSVECVVSEGVLAGLRSAGIAHEVLIDDLAAYYASRLEPRPVNALGFGYGSMGGYYTLNEVRRQLDTLRLLYPNVVGKCDSIGASLQGRPIWAVRMTSNPDAPFSGRPQVLYFAMQHAREPIGMMTLLYTMWYLAGHYGQDPEATHLLDNRELWFVPVLNVDGYEANRRMQSWGGGMRRKNMRNVATDADAYGVDLNRNWDAGWGTGDSSPNQSNEVYCGAAPFSEPETGALRDFGLTKAFRFVMEYHAYGLQIYSPDPALLGPDTLLFQKYLLELTRYNHYLPWGETGLSGMAREWMYNYKPGRSTFPFLIEVGNDQDGFWPATSRIVPLVSENLPGNLFAAWAGGAFPKLNSHTLVDSSGDGDLEPGEHFFLKLRLRNFGQDPATAFSVSAKSGTPLLEVSFNPIIVGYLGAHADTTILLEGKVLPTAPGWARGNIVVTVGPTSQVEFRDTVGCIIGKSKLLFADGAENGASYWNMGNWGRSAASHTGQWSFTDSPAGLYPNNTVNTMTLTTPVAVPQGIESARLRFWTKWRTETWYDYGQVLVSTNGGSSWTVVPGEHTGMYMADGYSGAGVEWCEEDIDITGLAGQNMLLRLRFSSDEVINYDGWYVDDITVRSYSIPGLAYAHDARVARQGVDTLRITARVENPLSHTLKVVGTINSGSGMFIDSVFLMDDGLHGDSAFADGLWGYRYVPKRDDTLRVSIRTDDLTAGTSKLLPDVATYLFTRVALIVVDTRAIDLGLISMTTARYDTSFLVRNIGYAADSLRVSLDPVNVIPDTAVSVFPRILALAPGDSQKVTFGIRPGLLSASYYFAQVTVESKSAYGQTKFEKNYQFQVVISSISNLAGIPTVVELGQNYPNPFNPSTTIRYGLPIRSPVRLTVYNTLGQQVAQLVNGDVEAGYHEVQFDGSKLASGLYFYRIQAGTFVETRKLLLVR